MSAERAQIVALQNIVRIQDDMLRNTGDDDLVTMWRNEAYKASVHCHIIEEEAVQIARGELMNQRKIIYRPLMKEFSSIADQFQESVNRSLTILERRLKLIESHIRKAQIHRKMVIEDSRGRNRRLIDSNDSLRQQVESLSHLVELKEREIARLLKLLNDPRIHPTPQPSHEGIRTTDDVRDVLKQIRELEIEAHRILIKE